MASASKISRADLDQLKGLTVVEFGANWCGHCRAAQPMMTAALAKHPNVKHLSIEDGKGERLGRTYSIKLWPTLIFLKDGIETSRLVRPSDTDVIANSLNALTLLSASIIAAKYIQK